MRSTLFVILCLLMVFSHSIANAQQSGDKPKLSAKEVRRIDKKLKKLNASIEKKLLKLKEQLSSATDSTHTSVVPNLDSLKLSLQSENKLLSKVDSLGGKLEGLDSLGIDTSFLNEIKALKNQMKVGMQLDKENLKVVEKMNSSLLELTEMEYHLKDLNSLSDQLNIQGISDKFSGQFGDMDKTLNQFKEQMTEYQGLLEEHKAALVNWDKTLENYIQRLEAVQGIKEFQGKMIDPAQKLEEATNRLEGYQSKDFVNKQIQERFQKLLKEEGPDALAKRMTEGHQKLSALKDKFEEVQDITKPIKKKPNPYKGKPLKERLAIGGNFQINRSEPVTADLAAELAYKINKDSEIGIGSSYRIRLKKFRVNNIPTEVLNLRSFYHYRIWKNVGLQANYELNYSEPRELPRLDGQGKEWQQSGLAGFRIAQGLLGKFEAYTTIQYDFLHKVTGPNPKWVFRFGIRLN